MRISDWSSDVCSSDLPGMARYDGWGFPYECSDSGIAILPVQGTLRRTWGIGPYSGATGYDGLWTQLMHAAENDEVKAIFMPHNSGGGAVDGLEELAEAIYANSARFGGKPIWARSEEHTSELQSLMRISYAVFCLKKHRNNQQIYRTEYR